MDWWTLIDIPIEIWRIGNIRGLARELRSATTMFSDSFSGDLPNHENYNGESHKTAIFMQGFFANAIYYRRFIEFFYEHHVRVVCPLRLSRNIISYREAHELLSRTIKSVEDETGEPPILIGHSKGGTDIIGVLGEHPEIKKAYPIAPPLRGSSLNSLNVVINFMHHNPGVPIDHDILTDEDITRKITTFCSYSDRIVPPHEAMVHGAENKIVIDGDHGLWNSHTGLPYHARHEILERITNNSRKAA